MNDSPSQNSPTEAPPHPPLPQEPQPPRAFAQGVGVLLQTVGMVLFLSTCCVCSVAGAWDPTMDRAEVLNLIQTDQPVGVTLLGLLDQPGRAGVMLTVMFTTVGGLAMAGFGLGLQAQKPKSGWGAFVTNVLMLSVLIVAGVGLWVGQASWVARVWHALLTVLVAVLTGFAWVALKQMIANPPPADIEVLPKDFEVPSRYKH